YEYTLLNLVRNLSRHKGLADINGLIYREGYDIKVNPPAALINLDALPWPLREELPMHQYLDTPGRIPQPSVQMLASRGCPFGCNFCLWPQVMYHGRKYRFRDVIDTVDEMEYLVTRMGFKSVYFDDDTFNVGKGRMLRLCQEIRNRGLERIPWAIMARADLMDEEILTQMKRSGLAAVKYGVESATQKLVNKCGKDMDLKKVEKMILFTKALDLRTHLTFTFGLPGETKSTINRTIDYARKLKPFSVQFSITTPFPGTAYFNDLDKRGLVINKNWDDYDGNFKSVIKLDYVSSKDLELARRTACEVWDKGYTRGEGLKKYLIKFSDSYQQNGLRFALNKTFSYLKEKNIGYVIRKVQENYLDILGVLNGKYAFKGPGTIQIDLTDYCNNDCLACWCNSPLLSKERLNKPKDTLSTKLVKDLITETHQMGMRDIYFSGGGEPFMHPDILDILEHTKKLGVACAVNTNFTLINEKNIQRIIDLKIDSLTVSVWAATSDIYKALHPNKEESDFCRIRDMLLLLNSRKNSYPKIKIYNVICNLNYHQVSQMIDFAQETKSEFVEFTVVDTMPKATDKLILTQEQGKIVLEQCEEIKSRMNGERNNHTPEVLNFEHFMRRVDNLDAQQAQYDSKFIDSVPCYVGWLFARIMPNGDVNSCLKSHRFPVGNLHQHNFKKIWNSKKQVYFRQKTLKMRKDDPFFQLIGNDPECKMGCYKSCDDISRNISMHSKIQILSDYERYILKALGKTGLGKLITIPNER
ncbi:MAG: radical SAM protein, partial [Candidatus Omnitrophica bacterium]|nr:radical SAM protein [Candidatus Omnitrophota bacterium]